MVKSHSCINKIKTTPESTNVNLRLLHVYRKTIQTLCYRKDASSKLFKLIFQSQQGQHVGSLATWRDQHPYSISLPTHPSYSITCRNERWVCLKVAYLRTKRVHILSSTRKTLLPVPRYVHPKFLFSSYDETQCSRILWLHRCYSVLIRNNIIVLERRSFVGGSRMYFYSFKNLLSFWFLVPSPCDGLQNLSYE